MLRRTCSSSGANGVPLKVLVSCLRNFSCSRVNVSIDYRVRQTNTRANLVFPFYLGTLEIG